MSDEIFPVFPRLQTDVEFVELIPHIIEFCQVTKEPFWRCSHDVTSSMFLNSDYFTQLCRMDGKTVGYVCGRYVSPIEFYILQAQCTIPDVSKKGFDALVGRLESQGVREVRLLAATEAHVRLYEGYGFSLQKFYMTKEVR